MAKTTPVISRVMKKRWGSENCTHFLALLIFIKNIMTEMLELSGGEHAVLMLHGLSGSHLEMKRVGELLNKAGFTVFIPDIPGYCYGGESTSWQEWVAIARNHLHTLQPQYKTVSLL